MSSVTPPAMLPNFTYFIRRDKPIAPASPCAALASR